MSENCTHNCDTCGASCGDRNTQQKGTNSFLKSPHPESRIKYVIGVASGKGGVGKSTVTSLIATILQKKGYKTAILDADITGPSIPKMFGIHDRAEIVEGAMYPAFTHTGIQIMSANLILDHETDPVVWRGPIVAGVVQQFWTDVVWTDVDVMLIDMPPGTGDVPLTVYQSIPLDGLVVVTSPQQLVSMIVEKAIHMSEMMDIPILGLVENDSYYTCPDCGKKHFLYGESNIEEMAAQFGIETVVRLAILPKLAEDFDKGEAESFDTSLLGEEMKIFLDKMMEFEHC